MIVIIMIIISATNITGCGETYEKRKLTFTEELSENPQFFAPISQEFNFTNQEPITGIWAEKLEYYAEEMVEFLNANYDAEWNTINIKAYAVELEEAGIDFSVGGIYDPDTKSIYLDKKLVATNPEEITAKHLGFVVHEILHFLKDSNTGEPTFCLHKGKKILGFYFTEGMTNYICERYFEKIGEEDAIKIYNETGYASLTYLSRQLEFSIPRLIKYYCSDDIDGLEKEFNKLAKLHIKDGSEMFETWMFQVDNMYRKEHEVKAGDESAMLEAMLYVLSNTEIIAAITEKEYLDEFIKNFEEYDDNYWGVTFTVSPQFTDYFQTLFYEEK